MKKADLDLGLTNADTKITKFIRFDKRTKEIIIVFSPGWWSLMRNELTGMFSRCRLRLVMR